MKVRNIGLMLVGVLALAFSATAARAGDQDFTLVNKTGVEIHKIMVSPHDESKWGEDIMGKDTVPDGSTVEIKFHPTETAEDWDLKIEDKAGNSIVWAKLRLTKISKIVIHFEDGKATAELE